MFGKPNPVAAPPQGGEHPFAGSFLELEGLGGTCVNVGCVPKKLMYMAAQQRESMVGDVSLAGGFGSSVGANAGAVDWAGLKARIAQ